MTDSHPLSGFHHWFEEDREQRIRLIESRPATEAGQLEVALELFRLDAAAAGQLLGRVDELLHPASEHQAAVADWVGGPRLESLRRAHEGVDDAAVDQAIARMQAQADAQEQSGVADFGVLTQMTAELRGLVGSLWGVVADVHSHLQDKVAQDQIRAFEAAARQVPGTNLRITETVAAPDGTQHVVRDVMALGPDPDLTGVDVRFSLSTTRKQLLGLDDERGAEIAGRQVQQLRATRTLQRLGLPASASVDQVHERAVARVLSRAEVDADIGDVVGGVHHGLVGLMPGHWAALRASALLIIAETIRDAGNRGRRGDPVAGAAAEHALMIAMALVHGAVYYLPSALIPAAAGLGDHGAGLPAGWDIVVFHDRPVPLGADAEAIAWVFTTTDEGAVLDLGQVLLEACDEGVVGIELSNVSLRRGPAGAVAGRVLEGLVHPGWQVSKRRKLPGKPGEKAWRDALGRAAAAELRTGSLTGVHSRSAGV